MHNPQARHVHLYVTICTIMCTSCIQHPGRKFALSFTFIRTDSGISTALLLHVVICVCCGDNGNN